MAPTLPRTQSLQLSWANAATKDLKFQLADLKADLRTTRKELLKAVSHAAAGWVRRWPADHGGLA